MLQRILFRNLILKATVYQPQHLNISSSACYLIDQKWRSEKGLPSNPNRESILRDRPDYSFLDGRPTPYGTNQRLRILQQMEYTAISRIVAGSFAKQNEFPWIVAIIERGTDFNFCGGSIISSRHVLTAAHCTDDAIKDKTPLSIVAGGHDLRKPTAGVSQVIDVEKILQHEQYTPKVWKNDISVLHLASEVRFTPHVGRVCLPTQQMDFNRGYVKIIGWGATAYGGDGSPILKKVDVRVVPPAECEFMYKSLVDSSNPTQICTYAKRRASCQGDSGGPVVWVDPETNRYTLVGLVSFGRVCGDVSPTVHTDVAHYLPWIQRKIKASSPVQTCSKV